MDDMQYLVIIWAGVFISYNLANRTKLTPVLYFLAFGSLMVNIGVLPQIIALTLGLLCVQILSASLAARYTGSFAWY